MKTLSRAVWGEAWMLMLAVAGMSLALITSAVIYKHAPNLWFGLTDLYILIAVGLNVNNKISSKTAIYATGTASIATLVALAIIIRL